MKKQIGAIVCLVACGFFGGHCLAEDGVTADTIVLGRSAGVTGPQAAPVHENGAGAQLYFDVLNKHGGVNGRKIVLKTVDDGYDAKRTAENVKHLIEQDKVFALFLIRGTANTEAAMPIFTAARVPLIAPVSPATSMGEPLQKYIFNVRARGHVEIEKIVEQLVTLGLKKIAVAYADDGLGKDVVAETEKAMRKYNITPVAEASFGRTAIEFDQQIKQIARAEPQAVIVGAVARPTAAFVNAAKRAGLNPQFFALSNTSSDAFIHDLGENGRGVGVSQVVPHPWSAGTPLVKEFLQAVKDHPDTPVTHASLEGYMSAKVLAEGLKRAGPQLTRERLISALESMANVDIGGVRIAYSPEDHQGSDFVELTVIGKDGQFMR